MSSSEGTKGINPQHDQVFRGELPKTNPYGAIGDPISSSGPRAMAIHRQTTGKKFPTEVNSTSFDALVSRGGRTIAEGRTQTFPIMGGQRIETVTRHRSGSLTGTHTTPGQDNPREHRAYHYSATDRVMYSTKNSARAEVVARQQKGL